MKLERVAHNKLKVTLTSADVAKWGIKFDHFAYNTPEVQELFWSIMKQAETELNFFADGSQLFVEAISTRTDGFILMVTKLDDANSHSLKPIDSGSGKVSSSLPLPASRKVSSIPEISVKKAESSIAPIIFAFTNFDNAVNACKQLGDSFDGNSTLYKYLDKYYLVLELNSALANSIPTSSLLEYGTDTYQPALFHGRLSEHGEVLIESNAIETFCTYF